MNVPGDDELDTVVPSGGTGGGTTDREQIPMLLSSRIGGGTPLLETPSVRYSRTGLHAAGGMGTVWRARDVIIGRDVALKELKEDSRDFQRRFVQEARITGRLEHPGVVPVYELGRDHATNRPFYTMRFIRGRTLLEKARAFHDQRRGSGVDPLEFVFLLDAFVSICNTIAFAHSRGIIHRDLKGANVVLGDFGEVVVLDWGVAKEVDAPEISEAPVIPNWMKGKAPATIVGEAVGTPNYMAPEQAEGNIQAVGTHSDIFGLGAILYEILTGRPPYPGGTAEVVIAKAAIGKFPRPSKYWPEVPPELEEVCLHAMARNPRNRHASAVDLANEVRGWQDRRRRQAEESLHAAYDRLKKQQAALVMLTRVEIFRGPDLNAIFRRLVAIAAQTLKVDWVSIWRFSEDRRVMRCQVLYELGSGRYSGGLELQAVLYPRYFQTLGESDVIAANDAQHDPRTSEFTEGYLKPLNICAMMDVPVGPHGVLCCEHMGSPRPWTPDEQLFAVAVGNLAAHAITLWDNRKPEGDSTNEIPLAPG